MQQQPNNKQTQTNQQNNNKVLTFKTGFKKNGRVPFFITKTVIYLNI